MTEGSGVFSDSTPLAKINKWNYIKLKSTWNVEGIISQTKELPTEWKDIFAHQTLDKRLIFNIHEAPQNSTTTPSPLSHKYLQGKRRNEKVLGLIIREKQTKMKWDIKWWDRMACVYIWKEKYELARSCGAEDRPSYTNTRNVDCLKIYRK